MTQQQAEAEDAIKRKFFEREKKIKIAQAAIDGLAAILRIAADTPKFDFGVASALMIAGQVALTAGTIAKIASTSYQSSGGSAPSLNMKGNAGTSPVPPSGPIASGVRTERPAETLESTRQQTIVKAIVTETELTRTQLKVRAAEERSRKL